ncbi:MAG: hypothetical protein HUK14_08595 [Muribaculaceae bacterium]|nr:hypothetical protein [Muribaculaceae bacterium]
MKKISFKDIYNSLPSSLTPKARFISEVAALTKKKEITVRMWLCNHNRPDNLTIKVIADHFNVDPSALFPNSKSGKQCATKNRK